jgi:Uma2 family endonuclease
MGDLHSDNPFLLLTKNGPVMFKSNMDRKDFHALVLRYQDFKIERDKYGLVTIFPPMTLNSGYDEGEAFYYLKHWSKTNDLGRAFSPSTSFDLPDGSTHKADGAWISIEKINRLSAKERKGIAAVTPDFVMEVRSQTDRIGKLKKKMADIWMANGVRLAWLIDPLDKKAWIYRAGESVETFADFDAQLSGEDVLPGFVFDLKML